MSASSLLAIPTLAAVASAQFTGYPTTMYGQAAGYQNQMMMGGQFGFGGGFGGYQGGFGGGYGGNYGRQCRSSIRSEDLRGGFQQCFCDKNHRDEDFCSDAECVVVDKTVTLAQCRKDVDSGKWAKDYYDDIFDEDCVQQWQQPTNVRRCPAKTRSKDLAGTAVCLCDSKHKKDTDDIDDALDICSDAFVEEELIANHYTISASAWATETGCEDAREPFEEYDPNCVERFGGYGSYGSYGQNFGGYNMGFGAGYGSQQNFGGFNNFNMGFGAGYPTQYTGGYGARYMGGR